MTTDQNQTPQEPETTPTVKFTLGDWAVVGLLLAFIVGMMLFASKYSGSPDNVPESTPTQTEQPQDGE